MVRKRRMPLHEYLMYLLNTTTKKETVTVVYATTLQNAVDKCVNTVCKRGYKVLRGKQI